MKNFTDINKLINFLKLSPKNQKNLLKTPSFKLNLPYRLAKKIAKNDINDPIFKQFVPIKKEEKKTKGFSNDPLCEKDFIKTGPLIQKYNNRALLITSNTCTMNCRFCFRRHFSYEKKQNVNDLIDAINAHVKNNPNIHEIILSGGDPLTLNNQALEKLLLHLNDIKNITRIRIHTRALISVPEKIDNDFLKILSKIKKQLFFVLHINHKNELDIDVLSAIKKLQSLKIPVFSQTVLLKDINDNVETLNELFDHLTNNGVIPYYLHQLDKVAGAKHFEVCITKGKNIIKKLREINSGYAVPSYVQELPYKKSKTLIL